MLRCCKQDSTSICHARSHSLYKRLTNYKQVPSDHCSTSSVVCCTCVHSSTAPHNWVDGEDWTTHSFCHRNIVLFDCVTVHCWVATTRSAVKCKGLISGSISCHILTWDGELWWVCTAHKGHVFTEQGGTVMCVVHWRGIHGGNVCALSTHPQSE